MRAPVSTYRLQFRPEFGFDDATAILDYLQQLGITHVYASPYLQAAPGSAHGYDVVDPAKVNVELGGEEARDRFVAALRERGMSHVLDIVPNHMAIPGRENAWWWDVLKHGRESAFARFFDIDWNPPEDKLRNTILVPVLGDHYGRALDRGEIQLAEVQNEVVVRYYDNEFPIDPATAIGVDLEAVNKDPDALDALLEQQHFRLAYWRVAGEELDYRRFFDVNTLVALHMEDPEVFAATHGRVLEWLRDGSLDGIRLDHIDGLRDPAQYFDRLREAAGQDAWIVAEKILEHGERLPSTWPIAGTTGYDALNAIDGLFVEPAGEVALTTIYERFVGTPIQYSEAVRAGKELAAEELLASDVDRLVKIFARVCQEHRDYRDYTRTELREVLRALVIAFPVYRSYVSTAKRTVTSGDRDVVSAAMGQALDEGHDAALVKFLGRILLLEVEGAAAESLAMRFQQLTGPVMAKGLEDTAFYRYFRLASRNEVGGDPGQFAVRPDDFHSYASELQRLWPSSLLSSTTHDTKRSEDVRHRLSVLSEIPELWDQAVTRWTALNAHLKRPVDDERTSHFPDRNTEYLIYQTLVGAFPIDRERLQAYLAKATKEAKVFTAWTEPNAAFDDALQAFCFGVLENATFLMDLEAFVVSIIERGRVKSLAATAVKLMMPGVPDTYQGTELWDLSLVDPDNRRPVDYDARRQLIEFVATAEVTDIVQRMDEGAPKLHVVRELLHLRRSHPEWFGSDGTYDIVWTNGPDAHRVFAFARSNSVITVVPRSWGEPWDEGTTVSLPEGEWKDVLTDKQHSGAFSLRQAFADFPVAVLIRTNSTEEQ